MTPGSTPSGREQILGAVREQLARSPETSSHDDPPLEPPAERSTDAVVHTDRAGRAAAFEQRLTAVGGCVHPVADAAAAARVIERIAGEHNAQRIGVSDAPELGTIRGALRCDTLSPDAGRDELLACEVGLTTAQWGIAETGSLVLVSGEEHHRRLSLTPTVHIAVLSADRIVATLGEALAKARGTTPAPPGAITLITGPSRTADIELTLVVGVHGPKELHVLLLSGAGVGDNRPPA